MGNEERLNILNSILSQVKIKDPNIRIQIENLIKIGYRKVEQTEANKEIVRRLRIQNKKLLEQVALSKEKLREGLTERAQLAGKLNYLIKVNNSLSGALGSCPECWGEDPGCDKCSGNGIAGWRNINRRLFNMHVLPCLEKWYDLKKLK
jgi:hypothetical protein